MYCFNCGKQIKDGSSFCTYCGKKQHSDIKISKEKTAIKFPWKKVKYIIVWVLNILICISIVVAIMQILARSRYEISSYQSEIYQNGTDAQGYPHLCIEMDISDNMLDGKLCNTFMSRDFVINDEPVDFYYPYTQKELDRFRQDIIDKYHEGNTIYMLFYGCIALVAYVIKRVVKKRVQR